MSHRIGGTPAKHAKPMGIGTVIVLYVLLLAIISGVMAIAITTV